MHNSNIKYLVFVIDIGNIIFLIDYGELSFKAQFTLLRHDKDRLGT